MATHFATPQVTDPTDPIPSEDTDDGDGLRARLSDFAAGLLALRRHQAFVWRLLRRPPGAWSSVCELCAGAAECPAELCAPEGGGPGDVLHVMWVPWPGADGAGRDRAILFLHEELFWTFGAYYNGAVGERPPFDVVPGGGPGAAP